MKKILLTLFITTLLVIGSSHSADKPSSALVNAAKRSAKAHGVSFQVMLALAKVESSYNVEARRQNRNGTLDVGPWQINSVHLKGPRALCRKINIYTLTGNAMCAAKLLAVTYKKRHSDPLYLSRYHSKTPSLKKLYAAKLDIALMEVAQQMNMTRLIAAE